LNAYARIIGFGTEQKIKEEARAQLYFLFFEAESDLRKTVEIMVDDRIRKFGEQGMSAPKATLEELKSEWAALGTSSSSSTP